MAEPIRDAPKILRRKQLEAQVGLKRSCLYDKIKKGEFPAPIRLGNGRAVGWIASEIDNWLVIQIERSRKSTKAAP